MRDDHLGSLCLSENALFGPTPCKSYSWDPGVKGGGVWQQVEGLQVCLGTLLCDEVQLGALTWLLQHVQKEKRGLLSGLTMTLSESPTDRCTSSSPQLRWRQ